jgi:hypothetical protein
MRLRNIVIVSLVSLLIFGWPTESASEASSGTSPGPKGTQQEAPVHRRFTTADDVLLSQFWFGPGIYRGEIIKFSPNRRYFSVVTERGLLDRNAPEDTIWIFTVADVQDFVRHFGPERGLAPKVLVRMASGRNGSAIDPNSLKWLDDSSAIAFLADKESSRCRYNQLLLAHIGSGAIEALTPDEQNVESFDIRATNSYVYEATAPRLLEVPTDQQNQSAWTLTGKSIWNILFPLESMVYKLSPFNQAGLWSVNHGHKQRLVEAKSHKPISLARNIATNNFLPPYLSLSPDGTSLVAITKAEHLSGWQKYRVPASLKNLYSHYTSLEAPMAYHLIDLNTGAEKVLVSAPCGLDAFWNNQQFAARWSGDGRSLLLPNTFLPLDVSDPRGIAERETQPFIAVLRLDTGKLSPLLPLKNNSKQENYGLSDLYFADGQTVVMNFDRTFWEFPVPPTEIYREEPDGTWKMTPEKQDPGLKTLPFDLEVRESINQPPVIAAVDRASGGIVELWDPNPQLKDVDIGTVQEIHGKDATGFEWEAGVVLPPDYVKHKLYPLVIQTHGYNRHQFLSNGLFSNSGAARALAASGIAVAQIGEDTRKIASEEEAAGAVALYRSVVKRLTDDEIVDPARVGAIGFSRTTYHVLAALTAKRPFLAAAQVSDGVDFGYWEYLTLVDSSTNDAAAREAEQINGGKPFWKRGLLNWWSRSPEFKMGNVASPLLLVQPGIQAVFADWEPYAVLRRLGKPVDLIMLPADTHPISNPRARLAFEDITVDWFRFWLQGYEHNAPEYDAGQYLRWRSFCTRKGLIERMGRLP